MDVQHPSKVSYVGSNPTDSTKDAVVVVMDNTFGYEPEVESSNLSDSTNNK